MSDSKWGGRVESTWSNNPPDERKSGMLAETEIPAPATIRIRLAFWIADCRDCRAVSMAVVDDNVGLVIVMHVRGIVVDIF